MPTSATAAPEPARRAAVAGRPRGFTLLELLVVMAIAALLTTLVPMAYERLHDAVAYRDTVRGIASGLARARSQAGIGGREVAFVVDLRGRRFGIEGTAMSPLPARLQLRVTAAEQETGAGMARLRFYPEGHSTGGSIEILRATGQGVRMRADWLDGRVTQETLLP